MNIDLFEGADASALDQKAGPDGPDQLKELEEHHEGSTSNSNTVPTGKVPGTVSRNSSRSGLTRSGLGAGRALTSAAAAPSPACWWRGSSPAAGSPSGTCGSASGDRTRVKVVPRLLPGSDRSHLGFHHAQFPALLCRVGQQVGPERQHGGRVVVERVRAAGRLLLQAPLDGVLQLVKSNTSSNWKVQHLGGSCPEPWNHPGLSGSGNNS